MTATEMLEFQKLVFAVASRIAAQKTRDYASEDDPFANLRLCEKMGICSAQTGIQVRMCDKFQRIVNLTKAKGITAAVKDESVVDSMVDLINYQFLQLAEAVDRGDLKWQAASQDQSSQSKAS